LSSTEERPIGIFASFNIQTNRIERQEAADSVMRFGHEFNQSRIRPCDFRRMLADSLFVMSPPGNGIDCHRTWEALYMAVIPIVIKHPFYDTLKDFPGLIIDDWSYLNKLSEFDLINLYEEHIKKVNNCKYIWSDFWKTKIEQDILSLHS
jgi:hypothetical protein